MINFPTKIIFLDINDLSVAEQEAKNYALAQRLLFLPQGKSAMTVGITGKDFIPTQIKSDGSTVSLGNFLYSSYEAAAIRVMKLAQRKGLPCLINRLDNEVSNVDSFGKAIPPCIFQIEGISNFGHGTWKRVARHCNDYCKALNLLESDLEVIMGNLQKQENRPLYLSAVSDGKAGFLHFEEGDYCFGFYVNRVSVFKNDEDWLTLLQVACTSHPELNDSSERMNTVSEEWHQRLLAKLNEEVKTHLRKKLNHTVARNQRLWEQSKRHSAAYSIILGPCNPGPLKSLEIAVEDKQFRLYAHATCGVPYGGDWIDLYQACCINDPDLNEMSGGGTTTLKIIPEEWHLKLLEAMRSKGISNFGSIHSVRDVKYVTGYKLRITFEKGQKKIVDLEGHLEKEIFRDLKNISYFKSVGLDRDLEALVWSNGVEFSPDFLYQIGKEI